MSMKLAVLFSKSLILAVYNYRSSLDHHLNLSVGDAVHIIEEYEGN